MATKKLASIKGRAARFTRLDECGVPVIGSCSVVVTKGFISVELSEEVETGDEISQKNAWGEYCINDKDPDITKWVNATISLCEVDPDILDIVTAATPAIVGTDTIGASFGTGANTTAFALEVWTKASGQDACAGGTTEWGYFLVPFLKNGRLNGSATINNGAMNLALIGNGFANSNWTVGPHGDNPWLVTEGFPETDIWGVVRTTVQPPAFTDGCAALAGP